MLTISELRDVLSRLRSKSIEWSDIRPNLAVARGVTADGFSILAIAPSNVKLGSPVQLQVLDAKSGGTAFEFRADGITHRPLSPEEAIYQANYEAAVKEVYAYVWQVKTELDRRAELEHHSQSGLAQKRFFQ